MRPRLNIVTGLSGSGKTIALRALEDCGFSCVDNLPPQLIVPLADTLTGQGGRLKVAVGIDVRERQFLHELDSSLAALREKYEIQILFLEAEVDILVRRYKETRRPHPLSGAVDITEAVSLEREVLNRLRDEADIIIDTSSFNPHQLRRYITALCDSRRSGAQMTLTLMSFGFKYGVPLSADMVFDVRFLPNPHFVQGLRELTGLDEKVSQYVLEKPVTSEFLDRISGLMEYLLPHYLSEGRAYFTVAIGCTGGRHRSTSIAQELSRRLARESIEIRVLHRDL